jgi:TIR domain-containing protein
MVDQTTARSVGVFLSHCHTDKPFARKLASDLRAAGARVWLDEAEIRVGDSLITKVTEAIDTMDYLAVLLSPEAVASEWVRRELDLALNREIQGKHLLVLPLLLQDCILPGFLVGRLYADFRPTANYEEALQKLLTGIGLQFGADERIKELIESGVRDWEQFGILLDRERLTLLTQTNLQLSGSATELFVESLIAQLWNVWGDISQFYDKYQYGDDPEHTWPIILNFVDMIRWANQHGAGQQIHRIREIVKSHDSLTAPYFLEDLERLLGDGKFQDLNAISRDW